MEAAGVEPAVKATRTEIRANLQRAAAGTASLRFGWGSALLIVSEVVLSVGFMALAAAFLTENGVEVRKVRHTPRDAWFTEGRRALVTKIANHFASQHGGFIALTVDKRRRDELTALCDLLAHEISPKPYDFTLELGSVPVREFRLGLDPMFVG